MQTSVYRPREIHFFVLQFSRLDKDNHFNQKIGSRFNLKNPVLPVLLGTNKWLVDLDLECVQWRSEDWKDIIKVRTGHQAVPGLRRKMARSQLEERETVQAPGRKSRRRLEQGRSGVGQKADRNQPADTDQDLQSTAASNRKKGIQMSNMTIAGQGTTILRNHSKY